MLVVRFFSGALVIDIVAIDDRKSEEKLDCFFVSSQIDLVSVRIGINDSVPRRQSRLEFKR